MKLIIAMSISMVFSFSLSENKDFFDVIKQLLSHLDTEVSTIEEANIFAQKNFLLKQEEWFLHPETELRKKLFNNQELLLRHLNKIGMIQAIFPKKKRFDYALVMGSFKNDVTERLIFLQELLNNGYHCKNIVLLGGQRPLFNFEKEGLLEHCTTEILMMDYLSKQYFPLQLHQKFLSFNAPMICNNDGTLTRPTTESTLKLFAATVSKPSSCLIISNNPYIIRQTKVAQRILNQSGFQTEGTGPAFDPNALDIAMLMDEFARRLYEECKMLR